MSPWLFNVYMGGVVKEVKMGIGRREALWQVSRMYDVGGKLLNGIKKIYVNSLTCIKVKGGESNRFRTDNGVRQGCIMPLGSSMWIWIAEMKEVKMGMERMRMRLMEGERGDYLASCIQMTW